MVINIYAHSFLQCIILSGAVFKNKDDSAADEVRIERTIIGYGGLTSANNGENIVEIFAPALQKPKAVPANIAGKRNEFPR